MQGTTVVCPGCQKAVALQRSSAPGVPSPCPTCGTALPSLPSNVAAAPADWWASNPPAPAAPVAVRPRPAIPATPAPQPVVSYAPLQEVPRRAVQPLLLAGFIGGGVLLLLGVGLVLLVLIFGGKKSKDHPAVASQTHDTPSQPKAHPPAVATQPPPSEDFTPVRPPRIERASENRDRPEVPPVSIAQAEPEKGRLPIEEQQRVDKAIDKGLAFLTRYENETKAWAHSGNGLGHAAIVGLTMLECGVRPEDPRVLRAAEYVRMHAPGHQSGATNYEISLSLLFLDRLGDRKDEKLIRTMGLRLVAGQGPQGGWNYVLPIIPEEFEEPFLHALTMNRPRDGVGQAPVQPSTGQTDPTSPPLTDPMGVEPNPPIPNTKHAFDPSAVKRAVAALPPALRHVPALGDADVNRQTGIDGDNSNTQFATLALWVAGRHGVPIERSMVLLGQRFRTTQGTDGNWGYHANQSGVNSVAGPGAMTGAGLLGLAVAHGVGPDKAPGNHKPVKDEHIQKGLEAFGQQIGKPLGVGRKSSGRVVVKTPGVNLYFLWTLERVAVLYRLETLNGQDWYAWGAELLVDNQHEDGSWGPSPYPGSQPAIDTCFALLFLKRANLARDLTQKLEYVIDAKDPGTGR